MNNHDNTRVRLTPLGGVGQFGRNCLLIEVCEAVVGANSANNGKSGSGEEQLIAGDAVLIDCGIRFPGPELPGFDAALPDLERLAAVGDRLKGLIVTHGHEDHIGAIPFVLRDHPGLPVYATDFTARFIERRCRRHNLDVDVTILPFGQTQHIAGLSFVYAAVSHSIPGAACVILDTPVGRLVHSGDFRVDEDPILGPPTDMAALTVAGDEGVDILLADSTGATVPGRNPGERSVEGPLNQCFLNDDGDPFKGLLVVGLFASHLQRLALLAELCRRHGRKLLLMGRGLEETFALTRSVVGEEAGAAFFADVVVDERTSRNFPRERLCIAATGSQGEARATLGRLANRDGHLPFALQMGDRVVFSARVIPGNELSVQRLKDAYAEIGVDVVAGRNAPHVSGHGSAEDMSALMLATRPTKFVALHGAPGHLVAHGGLAHALGLANDQVLALRDGHSIIMGRGTTRHLEAATAHEPASVGDDVCDFPRGLAASRRRMHEAGIIYTRIPTVDVGEGRASEIEFVAHGVFPALSTAEEHGLRQALTSRLANGNDDEEILRGLRRALKGRFRYPEFVLHRLD